MAEEQPLALGAGFAIGVAAMLGLRALTARGTTAGGPAGLVATVGLDMLVDGLLIGVAFAAGSSTGILITIALTLEVFFLGLVAVLDVERAGDGNVLAITVGLVAFLGLGATIGTVLLGDVSGGPFVAVLAFATAALLYLVTEELLVEAHKVDETALGTTVFFAGFLLLLLLETAT